ncbi:MAG TPA: hydrogenase/urease maturation nickel metallochaperone HypA [Terriglobia bacterium]|nr:hydrogenase/urease maturation nickel metallochaperone HypA [Terriglobia bacterium]
MHEASLMKDLMRKIEAVAQEQKAKQVVGISVRLGALSHMSANHFREHFAVASHGTIAEGAELNITVLTDLDDAHAQEIVLESVEIAE